MVHALATAEECLAALDPGAGGSGLDDPARRPVGQLRTRLEYADPEQLPGPAAGAAGTLQAACVQASEAITKRYFQYEQPVAWEQEG